MYTRLEQLSGLGLGDAITRIYGATRDDLEMLAFITDQVKEFAKVT